MSPDTIPAMREAINLLEFQRGHDARVDAVIKRLYAAIEDAKLAAQGSMTAQEITEVVREQEARYGETSRLLRVAREAVRLSLRYEPPDAEPG